MAKGHWIACYRPVSAPAKLAEYAKLGGPAPIAAGGKALARGGTAEVFEAGVEQRTVLLEFESVEKASRPMTAKAIGLPEPFSTTRRSVT